VGEGYFKLYRKIQDHVFYKEKRVYSKFEAWLDLLMEARYIEEPNEVILGSTILTQNYGECLKSNRTWATRWGWSEPAVRRFFKLLEKLGQIRRTNEKITTRITILNYTEYNQSRRTSDAQVTQERRSSDAQVTTKEERKKGNKGKKENIPPYIPPGGSELKSNGDGWINVESWDDFIEHRKNIKKPLTEKAVKIALNFLRKNQQQQKAIIENTIMNRWTGLFDIKNKTKTKFENRQEKWQRRYDEKYR